MSLDRRLFLLVSEEILDYLPQFEPHSTDYQMVIYAIRDLKEWLKWKLGINDPREVDEKITEYLEEDPQTLKSLLNCWTGLWVTKWNERVEVSATIPNLPKEIQKKINDTRNLLRNMKYKKELKELVIQKLLGQG
ncbi:MAG: hypothetical protein QW279_15900, partial [Candidatus Jordarchaeaceae archaeon]